MHHLFILLSTSIHRLMNTSIRCTQTSQSITLFFKLINIKLRTKLTVLSFTYYYNRKKKQLILQPDNLYTPARMAGIYFIDHFRHNLGIIINSDNFLTLITANVLWENNSNTWLNMILAYVHINFLFSVKVSLLVEFLHSLEKKQQQQQHDKSLESNQNSKNFFRDSLFPDADMIIMCKLLVFFEIF